MKVLVIGASGHLGSYLVPELIKNGYEVFAVSRGNHKPYNYTEEKWKNVNWIKSDRKSFCENKELIDKINPDVVCDILSFNVFDVENIIEKLSKHVHYIQIGSIWIYEYKIYVPVDENHPRNAIELYGKNKAKIEKYLIELNNKNKLKCTVIHPGHISGKGWLPINPQGNLDKNIYENIKQGKEILLPFMGIPTLQHVHALDIAKIIIAAIKNPEKSNGQAFHAVAKKAMTMRGIAEELYKYYGHKPNIRYVELEEFKNLVDSEQVDISLDHIYHSPVCSMDKVKKLLGIEPQYSIMDIMKESLEI